MTDESPPSAAAARRPSRLHELLSPTDLGRLASGVAHDLNNILGPVVVYPELVRDELAGRFQLPDDDPVFEDLRLIESAALQAAAVIQDLLALTGQGPRSLVPADLDAAVQEVVGGELMEVLAVRCPGVGVRVEAPADLPQVVFRQRRLPRLVENLLGFAMGGGPSGTEVVVRLRRGEPGSGRVILELQDAGEPLSDLDCARIFEPFYARRLLGRAVSGLAMPVAQALTRESGGELIVEPGPGGVGTVLRAELVEAEGTAPEALPTDLARGQEQVLLVDDEEPQRVLVTRILEGLGYAVHAVGSGEEAVAWIRENNAGIVILDMVLVGGMDGLDTWREIVRIRPEQRAIIASGYSQSARVETARQLGVSALVQKPYTRDQLAGVVRKVLDASEGR